ncbi:MAG: hypothetical protein K0Q91_1370 [Fibrobacteria bacterium]|nr:hypothetical protein [Fibrobacteria bacterium]
MKKSLWLCLIPAALFAQAPVPPAPPSPDAWKGYSGYHRHDGFYLSLNLGPAFGGTVIDMSGSDRPADETLYRGGGILADLKIGGAVRENLILSFDIIGRTITRPEVEMNGAVLDAPGDLAISDNSYGIGLTRYFMPHNLFVGGTVSVARMVSTVDDEHFASKWGYGLHVKAGKEWWVSANWGLGVSAGYGFQAADDQEASGVDYSGELTSHQFYILFNTTYN